MVRHKAGLLKRKTQVVQQRTHVLAVVEHAELPPDQHPDEHGGPTGRLTAHDKRPGLQQLDQAFFLAWGQLWSTPTAVLVDEAVHAAEQKSLLPGIEAGWAEAPALA